MLGRESRRAKHETYLALHDNGDGTYTGKFTVELHGSLLRTALKDLLGARRLNKTRSPEGETISGYDESAPTGPRPRPVRLGEIPGNALCAFIEHLPTHGLERRQRPDPAGHHDR